MSLGSLVLSRYYHVLGLDKFWHSRANHAYFNFDANAIFRALSYLRILSPGSKKASFHNASSLIDRSDFSLADTYRALSFFSKYEQEFKEHLDKHVGDLRKRTISTCYYDVTNYYFEISSEDSLRKRGVSKGHRPCPIVQMGLLLDADAIPVDYELYSGSCICQLNNRPHFNQKVGHSLPTFYILLLF